VNVRDLLKKHLASFYVSIVAGFLLTAFIGIIDFLTGAEISVSVFYVLPVALVTWLTGRRPGLVMAFVCAVVWFWADAATTHGYSHALIPVWNAFIRLAFFVIITWLLAALRRSTEREREFSRVDFLTGAVNSRLFHELAQMEIDRFQRYKHPFTLAYIDLDNFKTVNDRFGHSAGDQVLRAVTSTAGTHLRKTDVFARLGGDEFAVLLPETNEESARVVLSKMRDALLANMRKGDWPVTFSIGALTCSTPPHSIDDLVRMADELMYSVKHAGKNAVKYLSYTG